MRTWCDVAEVSRYRYLKKAQSFNAKLQAADDKIDAAPC